MEHILALQSGNASVRMFAAATLAHTADERAVTVLIDALEDWFPAVRIYAATALGRIGDARAVPALLERANDNHDVHAAVAEALGEIGDVRAVPVLLAMLNDNSMECHRRATTALQRIGVPAALAILEAKSKQQSFGSQTASDALHLFGDRETLKALVLTDAHLTSVEKLSAMERLWRHWNPFLLGAIRQNIRQFCVQITNDSHRDAALRGGAQSVLTEMEHRRDRLDMLRACSGLSEGDTENLLQAANGTTDSLQDDLLRPSVASIGLPEHKRNLLHRWFSK
jgi:hypothetical protein